MKVLYMIQELTNNTYGGQYIKTKVSLCHTLASMKFYFFNLSLSLDTTIYLLDEKTRFMILVCVMSGFIVRKYEYAMNFSCDWRYINVFQEQNYTIQYIMVLLSQHESWATSKSQPFIQSKHITICLGSLW